ncbi:transporter substrate-binding domain-containing protein [Pasteurellaceae bacterium LIM206]|nr:transporter substrate-binding domain-containing protein [Pasteurellaceae bacterium LIM206]
MKKALLLTALLASASLSAQARDLIFGTEPSYPPFEQTTEKGDLVGFDIDIVQAICKEIGADCQFKTQAFDSLIQEVKQKRIDAAISAIDITPARAKQVAFTDPYYDNSTSFIAVRGKINHLSEVKNLGVQNGSTFQQYIVAEAGQYTPKAYPSLPDAVLDLKNGRIDAIFGDSALLADMISKEENLTVIGDKVENKKYFGNGAGIAVNKNNPELVAELNKGLAAIKTNGEYQKIYDKWMTAK